MSNFANSYFRYVNHLEQINVAAKTCPEKLIKQIEDAYCRNLQSVACIMAEGHYKVMMLSGPSSSGKTTTAYMLRKELRKMGVGAAIISLDDFYRGEGNAPVLPDGSNDYECVEALDVQGVEDCLRGLMNNRVYDVPVFDFTCRQPSENRRKVQLEENDVVIVEGIHALNPIFTCHLPQDSIMRVYISVKQGIKDERGQAISPMDIRLIRRIVRDYQFRTTAPEKTLAMWNNVIDGENKYIRPYRYTSDITINSIHIYEPCVFKRRAVELLNLVDVCDLYYNRSWELRQKLMLFDSIDENMVPQNSMLREFLGGKEDKIS